MHGAAKEAVDPATLSVAMQARREARKEAAAERTEGGEEQSDDDNSPTASLLRSLSVALFIPFSKKRTTKNRRSVLISLSRSSGRKRKPKELLGCPSPSLVRAGLVPFSTDDDGGYGTHKKC